MKAMKMEVKGNTISDVLESSGMNWFAETHEMITGSGIDVPSHKAIVRNDINKSIGVVGNRYCPVQNSDAFAFMDVLVQEHKAVYEHIYQVNGGSRVIVQARMNNDFEVQQGDVVSSYITMINSFDGTTPFKCYFTPIRLWCANQLVLSFKKSVASVSIRHTTNAMEKAETAFRVLGLADNIFESFKITAKKLTQKILDNQVVEKFLADVIGEETSAQKIRQRQEVLSITESGIGNRGNTLWDLYNGVTEWIDHKRGNDINKRMASALVGSGFNVKQKAWNSVSSLLDN
jgi:phage/plasmid-like protein (TIGR03299 family)